MCTAVYISFPVIFHLAVHLLFAWQRESWNCAGHMENVLCIICDVVQRYYFKNVQQKLHEREWVSEWEREYKNMLMTLWVNANFCIANGFNLAKRAIVSFHAKIESNGVWILFPLYRQTVCRQQQQKGRSIHIHTHLMMEECIFNGTANKMYYTLIINIVSNK